MASELETAARKHRKQVSDTDAAARLAEAAKIENALDERREELRDRLADGPIATLLMVLGLLAPPLAIGLALVRYKDAFDLLFFGGIVVGTPVMYLAMRGSQRLVAAVNLRTLRGMRFVDGRAFLDQVVADDERGTLELRVAFAEPPAHAARATVTDAMAAWIPAFESFVWEGDVLVARSAAGHPPDHAVVMLRSGRAALAKLDRAHRIASVATALVSGRTRRTRR
nr:hypothetical protein [Kofleriaceae bacterium]